MKKYPFYYLSGLLLLLSISCLHKVSQDLFPSSSSDIDYALVQERHQQRNDDLKRSPDHEYYFTSTVKITESELVESIKQVFAENRFKDAQVDLENDRVIAERGMTANEWNSICAIYYKESGSGYEIYALFKMTQDVTGGFDVNKAEKVGRQLETRLNAK